MDFTDVKKIVIPEGVVQSIRRGTDLLWERELPVGFKPLDYISANRNAWFDSEITPNTNTEIEAIWMKTASGNGYICGVTNSANTASVTEYATDGSANWRFGNRAASKTISINVKHTSLHNSSGATIDGTKTAYSTVSSFTSLGSLYVFANHTNGTSINNSTYWFPGRLYLMIIRNNGLVVAHFVPAKRISDSVAGMYDIQRNKFYTSQSGTNFTAGTEI